MPLSPLNLPIQNLLLFGQSEFLNWFHVGYLPQFQRRSSPLRQFETRLPGLLLIHLLDFLLQLLLSLSVFKWHMRYFKNPLEPLANFKQRYVLHLLYLGFF